MVSFEGYGENFATFIADETVKPGQPVEVKANVTVMSAGSGKAFCGIAKSVRNGCAAVQLSGYVQIGYSGTAPGFGYQSVVADGTGKIKAGTSDQKVLVVEVDPAAATCGIIL